MWGLVPETMAIVSVKGVALRLRSSVEQVALQLDAAEGVQVAAGPPTRLPVMIAFSSGAVHKSLCFGGVLNSSPMLVPIHSASLVGSHRKTRCAVRFAYVMYTGPGATASS